MDLKKYVAVEEGEHAAQASALALLRAVRDAAANYLATIAQTAKTLSRSNPRGARALMALSYSLADQRLAAEDELRAAVQAARDV